MFEMSWNVIESRKDMPKKSMNVLYMTDTGYYFTGYWNAHEKRLYHHNCENGKVISVKRSIKGIVAWFPIDDIYMFT